MSANVQTSFEKDRCYSLKSNKISIISIENEAVIDALSYKTNGSNRSDKVDTQKERLKKILRVG